MPTSNKNPPTGSILWEKADGLPIKCYSWVTTGKLMLLTVSSTPYFKIWSDNHQVGVLPCS